MKKQPAKKSISPFVSAYQELFLSLEKHLQKSQAKLSEGVIHQLRVNLKKIKAYSELVEVIIGKNKIPNVYRDFLKPIFKSFGEVRELQINYNLLRENFKDNAVAVELAEKFRSKSHEALKEARKAVHKIDMDLALNFKENILPELKSVSHEQMHKLILQYCHEKLMELIAIREKPLREPVLHEVRIELKKLRTIGKLFVKHWPNPVLKTFLQDTRVLEKNIGNWHDSYVLMEDCTRRIKKIKPRSSQEKRAYTLFLKKLNALEQSNSRKIALEIKAHLSVETLENISQQLSSIEFKA